MDFVLIPSIQHRSEPLVADDDGAGGDDAADALRYFVATKARKLRGL
jgi:hypothetical protein